MNIKELQVLIPAEFEYKFTDAAGVEKTETITLGLKRMSFSATTSQAFRDAKDNEDYAKVSEILATLIGEWNMTAGDEQFPPTVENIGACPVDFVGPLAECVFGKLFPNPPKAETSPDGSAQVENGTTSTADSESDTSSSLRAVTSA